MKREAHNYTLEYKNWRFELSETDFGSFYVSVYYKDNSSSMYIDTKAKNAEKAKERVEKFIKDELK